MLLLLASCVLWDTSPAEERIAELTDLDGDGVTPTDGDCDDVDPSIHPGAVELCDAIDNDCDQSVDEDGGPLEWCLDEDGDGHGDPATLRNACETPTTAVEACDDCDDRDDAVFPDGAEVCDGKDNDCDGEADPADATGAETWYEDADGDGYGLESHSETGCTAPTGYGAATGDCDDRDPAVHPDADETCNNGVDDNCDGTRDGCGLYGTLMLEEGAVAVAEGGYISGDQEYDALGDGMLVADVFGDGTADVIMGSQGWRYESPNGGEVSLWTSPPRGDNGDPPAVRLEGVDELRFGTLAGTILLYDYAETGTPQLLIGGRGSAAGFPDGGSLLSFEPATLTSRAVSASDVILSSSTPRDFFGTSLATSASLLEGAPALLVAGVLDDALATDGGAVFLFPPGVRDHDGALAVVRGEEAYGYEGFPLAPPADADGDGIDDLLCAVSEYAANPGPLLFHGPLAGEYATSDADVRYSSPSDQSVAHALAIIPAASGGSLLGVATAGRSGSEDGALYFVPGDVTGVFDLGEKASLILDGEPGRGGFQLSLAQGDLDGDRQAELIIGSAFRSADASVINSGATYVLNGPVAWTGTATVTDRADFTLLGTEREAAVGWSVAAGDVNNDGHDDLVVSGQTGDDIPAGRGGAWLLYGEGL